MSLWNSLSYEILQKILIHLKEKEQRQCQLTCRGWARASQEAAYTKIRVTSLAQYVSLLLTLCASSPFPGSFVKAIDINCDFNSDNNKKCFFVLIGYCPNLEEINSYQACSDLFKIVKQTRQGGFLKHLHTLHHLRDNEDIQYYNDALLTISDTAKHVVVCDSVLQPNTAFPDYKNHFNRMIGKLNEFKQLTSLCIREHTNKTLTHFDGTLNQFNRLNNVEICLYPDQTSPDTVFPGEQIISMVDIKPLKTVTQVYLNVLLQSEDTLLYIMTKFPNVKCLELNRGYGFHMTYDDHYQLDIDQLAQEHNPLCDTKVLRKFAYYLKPMTSYFVKCFYAENLIDIYNIWQTVLGVESLNIKIDFDFDYDDILPEKLAVVRKPGKKPKLRLMTYIGGNELVFMTYIRQSPSSITSLKIQKKRFVEPEYALEDEDFVNQIYGYYLDEIFLLCPHLKELEISFLDIRSLNPEACINNSIERLTLDLPVYRPSIINQLSARLPCLKFLDYQSISLNKLKNNSDYVFDMPYTSFEEFHLRDINNIQREDCAYVRVESAADKKIYQLNMENVSVIDDELFDKAKDNRNIITLSIKCKSFKEIRINYFFPLSNHTLA